MQSYFAVAILLVAGQVGGDSRYGDYDPALLNDPNQSADSADFFSPVTPPARQPAELPTSSAAEAPVSPRQPAAEIPPPNRREPVASVATKKPAELLRELSTPPESGRLAGQIISLADAVSTAGSRAEQTAIVSAYWDLWTALSDYYLSSREAVEMETLRQGIAQTSLDWDKARRAHVARTQLARRTAELAQHRLHALINNPALGSLPLPADVPHTGAYETRYQQNFAGRESDSSRQLDELLPVIHRSLALQAEQVSADQRWLHSVSQQRSPQDEGTWLLKTYDLVSLRRREFLRTVHLYNTQIAKYTELAFPQRVETRRLVAMLIESPAESTFLRTDPDVTVTGAEEPVKEEQANPLRNRLQRTYREETRPKRPITPGTPKGEHSIMVQPGV